ncbi:MAG: NapC/NirT family cytochrome c [Candidatus Riflebacteria bacterium]|nr:NapC/NirT family cytochrome c [Candidatus Riflebacteria bacterium]
MATEPVTITENSTPKLSIFGKLLWLIGIEAIDKSPGAYKLQFRFYAIVGLILLGVSSFGGLVVYSTSPSFCRSCHIMEPYYKAWAGSKHKDIACVECHYPPGSPQTILWKKFQALSQVVKYVTRTYSSKPFAEVEDSSCLREGCHATRLLQGKVVTKSGVKFDHKPHLEGVRKGRKLRCVSCHSQLVVGKHIEVTYDTCFLCHLKNQKDGRNLNPLGGCLGCHNLPDKEFKVGNITYNHKTFLGSHQVECQSCHQDVIQGNGDVSQDKCLTCHNQPEKLARYGDDQFIHENHVTKHNTACFHCHDLIKHAVVPAGQKKLNYDCNICHVDMHDLQKSIYMGLGAKGINPMPSPMYLANVDCVACHLSPKELDKGVSKAKTYDGTETGCLKCHGEQYKGVLSEVQSLVQETISKMENKVATVTAALKSTSASQTTELASQTTELADISYNMNFIKNAKPVHNIYYVSQILRKTDERLSSIAKANKLTVEDTSSLPIISGGFCATLCHAKVGVKVPAETVEYKGKSMPHKQHSEQVGLACTYCHDFGAHKDVKLKQPTVCKECHEGKE